MRKLGYLGLAAAGFLTACGGAQPEADESLASDTLMSSESKVIVGSLDWKSSTLLAGGLPLHPREGLTLHGVAGGR